MADKKPIILKITEADGSQRDAVVNEEQVIVGSGAAAGVKINDPKVSNLHFMLKVDKNGVVNALDLGSLHGTVLGGKRIIEQTALASGDTLIVGDSKIRVAYGDSERTDVVVRPPVSAAPDIRADVEIKTDPAAAPPPPPIANATNGAVNGTAATAISAKPPPPPPAEAPKAATPPPAPAPAAARPASKPDLAAARPASKPDLAPARPASKADLKVADVKPEPKAEAKPEVKAEPKSERKPEKSEPKAERKPEKSGRTVPRVVGAVGATAMLFNEELPAEETPNDSSKSLEVAQLWGDTIINLGQYGEKAEVTIGSEKGADFFVSNDVIGPKAPLVRTDGSNLMVAVPPGSDVVFRSERSQKSREQLKSEGLLSAGDGTMPGQVLRLGLHDRAMVTVDTVAFVVRWVRPQKAIPAAATDALDYYFTKVLSVTFMAFIVMWWAIRFTDLGLTSLSDDLFRNTNKYAKLLIVPPAEKKVKKLLSGVQEGKKAQKDEGKFGKKEAKKEDADPSKKGAPKLDPNKREEDRMKVAKSGLLAAFGKMNDGAASNVLGPGGLGTGINNALGGLKGGAGQGDAHGVGGLGSRGTGPGGGGTGLGLGGLGTKGGGRGAGGYGNLDLGGKGKDTVRVVPGKTTVVGSLSREEIERVIKRHQNEILFCYNTELNHDPNLAGKVAVNFTIDGSGAVSDASASQNTTNNNNVEQCMLSRIRRWKFPEPKGGGVVVVTYPWIFHAAGDEGGE
jgi:TonB family protein